MVWGNDNIHAEVCHWNAVRESQLLPYVHEMLRILFTQPLRSGRIWHKVNFLKRSLTGLISEFSFSYTCCLTKAEEPSLSYYLPIAGGRITGFIPFLRVLVLCEMQSVSSRIWTRVAVSMSNDDNHYTTGTSTKSCQSRPAESLFVWCFLWGGESFKSSSYETH